MELGTVVVLLVLLASITSGHLAGMRRGARRAAKIQSASHSIVASYPDVDIKDVRWLNGSRPEFARSQLPILYSNGLSFFRETRTETEVEKNADRR